MDPVFVYASDNAGQKALAQTAAPTFFVLHSCKLCSLLAHSFLCF